LIRSVHRGGSGGVFGDFRITALPAYDAISLYPVQGLLVSVCAVDTKIPHWLGLVKRKNSGPAHLANLFTPGSWVYGQLEGLGILRLGGGKRFLCSGHGVILR
jgi:hypothetical protein